MKKVGNYGEKKINYECTAQKYNFESTLFFLGHICI